MYSAKDILATALWQLVTRTYELDLQKKDLKKQYIDPIEEEQDLLKQRLIEEWKIDPDENRFYGTEVNNKVPHVTISRTEKQSIDYEKILSDIKITKSDVCKMLWITDAEYYARYVSNTISKPTVRIYAK